MKRKVSPGLRASLDASNTWRALLPCGRGKIDKMSLIPNSPSPFVRGLVSYSGRGNHVNSARHAQDYPVAQHTMRAKQLLNTTRAGLVRCFTWERVSRARQNLPTRKKTKKNARHAKKHDGRSFTERAPTWYACRIEPKPAQVWNRGC